MEPDKALRAQLVKLLSEGQAHATFKQIFDDVPPPLRGKIPPGCPHSLWQLLEHLRIAQWDILEFSRNPKHVSPDFPSGYWPKSPEPPNDAAWDKTIKAFQNDLKEMNALIENSKTDLFAPIPHGKGQPVLREALVLADHNAYHLGQAVLVRRLLGNWKD
jgi:DinB superfamily